jgi:hypothetical protein
LSELEKAYKNATYLSTDDANFLAKKLELTGKLLKIQLFSKFWKNYKIVRYMTAAV